MSGRYSIHTGREHILFGTPLLATPRHTPLSPPPFDEQEDGQGISMAKMEFCF